MKIKEKKGIQEDTFRAVKTVLIPRGLPRGCSFYMDCRGFIYTVAIIENTALFSLNRIQHNGRSFSPEKEDFQKGYGLNNIYENAKLLKATLQFSQENEKVLIKLPIGKN